MRIIQQLEAQEVDDYDEDDESDDDWKGSPPSKFDSKQSPEECVFYFLPSSRGCQVLVIDGCLLHQNSIRTSGKSYWRCQKKGCFFKAVYDPRVDKVTKTTGLHNHPSDSNQMIRRQFINNVKSQIIEHPHIPARQIYEKEVLKVQQELDEIGVIWKVPPFSCVKHHVYRAQRMATKTEDEEGEDEDISEEQPIQRKITEIEKKFLDESAPVLQEEEAGLSSSLLPPGPALIHSKNFPDLTFYFIPSKKGKRILVVNDFTLRLNSLKSGGRYYWKCTVDPCMFRCVYNENLKDLVKVSGKHSHASNVNRLRIREFCFILKARMTENSSLTPKKAYDEEVAKIRSLENGDMLVKCLPAYSSIRTSLYNQKHKRVTENEQKLLPGSSTGGTGYNNYYMSTSVDGVYTEFSENNLDRARDISPKDITHLSLEDNDPMEHDDVDDDDRGISSSSSSSNPMEIAAPSLYDNHDIIDQFCGLSGKSQSQEETSPETEVIAIPNPTAYSLNFVPTKRGGRALVVNGCILRISYTRDFVTYWRCLNTDCGFRCSYDSKRKQLIRISGEHNHPVNRYSFVIRTFVRKVKKRVCQESDLSPKIIYDEELAKLKGDGEDVELLKRLPSYESLKSSLYKMKGKSAKTQIVVEDSLDCVSDTSEKEDQSSTENLDDSLEDPPYDPYIEKVFSVLNAQLPAWMDQDPEKRLLDGHLLMKKSSTESSTGWACTKEDCPFRCVVDTETNAITRSQWDHTHKSIVKHTIVQAVFNAVKQRAVMDYSVLPKVIYQQERKRAMDKLSGNKALIKFIPSLTQVYQLITKTRVSPPAAPKVKATCVKFLKQAKNCTKPSGSKMNLCKNTSNTCVGTGQFDTDYLLEHYEDDGNRVNTFPKNDQQQHHLQQQSSFMYKEGPSNMPTPPVLDGGHSTINYQQSAFGQTMVSPYTNTATTSQTHLHANSFPSAQQQAGFDSFSFPSKSSHYVSLEPFLHQHEPMSQPVQQQSSTSTLTAPGPQQLSPLTQDFHSMFSVTQDAIASSDNVFFLHGYPLTPITTTTSNTEGIYWQCQVPGCRFQCLFNTATSQIVQTSGSHNHAPTGSQSAFCSQVVTVLQRKAAENLDEPLNNIYWEYMKSLREVLQSEEITNSLPRFQDVAVAMQSCRAAMGVNDVSHQAPHVITGAAVHSNKVYEFHFDAQTGALVINGDLLVSSWRMHEISYWRCKHIDCRFKCVLDDELQCVHILNPHSHPCPSYTHGDDRHLHAKRKYPDKSSLHRLKIQRIQ